ncbi:MAG: hypothetical protein NVS2B3_14660 [Vulcanimicrobiaceae bacterium]
MFEFLKSLFNPAPPSGATAKERLRVVLLSDHLSLAPEVVASLKKDLLAVISRYVTIDPAHADVSFEHRDNEISMLANIPITGVRERPKPTAPASPKAGASSVTVPSKSAQRRRRRKKAGAIPSGVARKAAPAASGYSSQA